MYGANRSLESLIMHFQKRAINIEVLLPSKGELYKLLQKNGIKVHSFMFLYEVLYVKNNIKYLSLPLLWLYDWLAFPFLLYKIHQINPDVIYANSSVDAFSIWIAKLLNKRHVVHVREFMYEDFGAQFLFGRKAKKIYLEKSDKMIFVSQAVANSVVGNLLPTARVIYNGVKKPNRIKKAYDFSSVLRLGVVGNLDVSKQQDVAIKYMTEIVAKFPNVRLHIIGDKKGAYKNYIYKLVDDLHLNNIVKFDGFIKNVDEIYDKFDVLLMCSRSEAFGRVTIEAMQRNIPVIGYDSAGTSELIIDGVTGFKYTTIVEIVKALDVLISDSQKTREIIKDAKMRADSLFSEQAYVENVLKFVME